ncbi:MAG TPA: hypothetical protein VMT27_08705 [Actinomycetes bacterium]|nr:hypothetical protein [Actinomycetes bacterium]
MKLSPIAIAVAGLVAASVLPLSGIAGAVSDPPNLANLTVAPGGVKKAVASWSDGTSLTATAFDAYLVTADDDKSNGASTADRSRLVGAGDLLTVTFDDLSSGTTYYFNVYAVDYTNSGVDVVPPTGQAAGTPIGYDAAEGATLTINTNHDVVKAGKSATVYGTLTGSLGALAGKSVTLQSDPFPFEGTWLDVAVTTDSAGKWSKSFSPTINTRYRAFYQPAAGVGGWTRNASVEVRRKVTVQVAPGATVAAGTQLRYSGKLGGTAAYFQPPYSDPTTKACLQRLSGGKWGTLKCSSVNTDGSYVVKHSPGADQDGKYRIYSGMGPAYATSWSRSLTITVN